MADVRVLHVDAESDVAATTAASLERHREDFDVVVESESDAALDRLASSSFDCVVSGSRTADVDGLAFFDAVRSTAGDVPFVVFAADGDGIAVDEALSRGVTDYVQRTDSPAHFEVLAHRIEMVVRTHRREREHDATRRRYEQLVEKNLAGIYIVRDGTFDYVNPTLAAMCGCDREEMIDAPVREFVAPEDRDRVARNLRRRIEAETEDLRYRFTGLRTDGERIEVEVYGSRIEHEGEPAVMGTVLDVTDREESRRRLETLVDNLPGIAYRCRNEPDWPMEYVDGSCEAVTGYTATELEDGAVSYGDVVHPDDAADVWESVQEAVDADEPFEVTYRIVTKDEDVRWVWERGRLVSAGDDGPDYLEGFVTDVTDQRERERELERQQAETERYQELLEHALMATDTYVWEWRLDDDEISRFPSSTTMFGLPSSIIGEVFGGFTDRVHPDDRDRVERTITEGIESGEGYQLECRFRTRDGSWRWVRDRADVVTDGSGDPVRAVGSVTDVTDQRERERELERKNRRLDEFASIVSHDLRNPLDVALGRLEVVRDRTDGDDEHLARVVDALDRMERIVAETLTLARQGKTVSEPDWQAAGTVARDSWKQVDTADATLAVSEEFSLLCDGDGLRHLFENLFRNAVQHGGPEVTVRVGATEEGFYVADDGPGIPEDERQAVFESGHTTADHGTGFGLSIVVEVAKGHDWTVRVTDGVDGGARFEFTGADVRR